MKRDFNLRFFLYNKVNFGPFGQNALIMSFVQTDSKQYLLVYTKKLFNLGLVSLLTLISIFSEFTKRKIRY